MICVRNGTMHYQESHARSTWHGEADRAWGALSVVYQWLLRTRWNGTVCFQHSGRDDQRQTIDPNGVDDGFRLPAMLWHTWWPEQESPVRASFLWPEYGYEGEITHRGQPPTRVFREQLKASSVPWAARKDVLRYRGGVGISPVRADILICKKQNRSARLSDFYRNRTDIAEYDRRHDGNASALGGGGSASMSHFQAFRHILWLPGAYDWSSSLNRFMAFGSTLVMPADLSHRHSLNSMMLLERCASCVITFQRKGSSCNSLMDAFLKHEAQAESSARRLSAFVSTELSPDCVDEYIRVILDGLARQQRVLEPDMIGRLRGFSCAEQVDKVATLSRFRHGGRDSTVANFRRWFDQRTCSNMLGLEQHAGSNSN